MQVFKDERLSQLDALQNFSAHSGVLKKMYLNQILKKEELAKFESLLADHQRHIMSDGLTIVERAVIEHNMIGAGKLYLTIGLQELGHLLGIDASKAQKVASTMIMDGMLKASIDQVDNILTFKEEQNSLITWDQSISNMCVHLNKITETLKAN